MAYAQTASMSGVFVSGVKFSRAKPNSTGMACLQAGVGGFTADLRWPTFPRIVCTCRRRLHWRPLPATMVILRQLVPYRRSRRNRDSDHNAWSVLSLGTAVTGGADEHCS